MHAPRPCHLDLSSHSQRQRCTAAPTGRSRTAPHATTFDRYCCASLVPPPGTAAAAVAQRWRQHAEHIQKYLRGLPEISGLAPLPRALRHPAAAAGAAGPAVDTTSDALPLGSALDAQAAAETPPWRAHRPGQARGRGLRFGSNFCEFINRSYVTTKVI